MSTVEDIYELTSLQQAMLLHSLYDGAADMYLGQHLYTVEGPLDADLLARAWRQVFAAHPALRTSFHWAGLDKPLQVVHRDVAPAVHHVDWSGDSEQQQRDRLVRLLADDREQGYDLSVAPLQRLYLIRLGPNRHALAWSHHHLLLDGWSVTAFMTEVMARYQALAGGGPPPPAAPPYREYIAWLQRQDMGAAQQFWSGILADSTPGHLRPLKPPDSQQGTGQVDRHTMSIPADLERGLRAAAARHEVTPSTLVQATWAIVLRRYTGAADIAFGTVTSGRPAELPDVDRMIGLFANTLPVPITVPDRGDLGSWLRDLQTRHAAIRRYEFIPLADIKKWAGRPGQDLFESLVVFDNYSLNVQAGDGGDRVTVRTADGYDKVSLPLALIVTPEPVSELQLLVHRNRFDSAFAGEVLECLRPTLEAITRADRVDDVIAAAGPPLTPRPTTVAAAAPASSPAPAFVPPATPEEEAIAAVYRDVLDTDIDVTRSFFELGGDSFAAVNVINRIEGATMGLLAANPSVRELARALSAAAADQPDTALDDEIAELERQVAERADLEKLVAGQEALARIVAERTALERELAGKLAAKQQRAQVSAAADT